LHHFVFRAYRQVTTGSGGDSARFLQSVYRFDSV
jgi:hypothetical protein